MVIAYAQSDGGQRRAGADGKEKETANDNSCHTFL